MIEPGATLREIRKARISEVECGVVGIRIKTLIAWAEALGYDIEIRLVDK
jgi:hypothetical protein